MLIFSFSLVISFAVFISSALKIKHRPGYLLSIYLLFISNIVVSGLIANPLGFLNNKSFYLVFELVMLAVALGFWGFHKKPSLLGPWSTQDFHYSRDQWRKSLGEWRVIWVLAISMICFYAIGALLVLFIPPNTNDSLLNHLARVGFWLQHGNMFLWPTPSIHNLIYPVNANLLFLWTILFSNTDYLTGFAQWIAAFTGAVAIFGISRLLGWKRAPSIFAGLVWLSLPEILLQSTTAQQDLIVAVFYILSVYFFIFGVREKNLQAGILSGLALAIAIGTKQIALFLLPGSAIFAFLAWLKYRRSIQRFLLVWVISSMGLISLLGSYIYIQNQIIFHNPMGDSDFLANQIGGQKNWGIKENILFNSARFFYQSVDFTGFPIQIEDNLINLKEKLAKPIFTMLNLDLESQAAVHDPSFPFIYSDIPPIQEDQSWYGILGFFLVFLLAPIQFIRGIQKRDPFRIGLFLTSFVYSILVIAFRPGWDPFQGRYFIPVVTLTAPFLASIVRQKLGWKIMNWVITIFIIFSTIYILLNNSGKPLISYPRLQSLLRISSSSSKLRDGIMTFSQLNFPSPNDIWNLDRTDRQLIQIRMMDTPVKLVEDSVPKVTNLALGFSQYLPVFPLFGEHLTRKLFPVYPPERLLDKSWFEENKIDFLLLHLTDPQMPDPPAWLIPYQTIGNWALYYPEWNKPPSQ